MPKNNYSLLLVTLFIHLYTFSQESFISGLKDQINDYKNDIRGPYHRIKWFCKDGTIREPKDPCPDSIGGGIQHATYKESVTKLAKDHHLFFGEILSYTNAESFWDETNNKSRLKQYQLGKYLSSVDDGWILRKGQFYRGAIQSEDEEAWGIEFYEWLLKNDNRLRKNYYLVRQSLKDVPHDGDNNLTQLIRSQSKIIAEEFPDFMNARIKIHGKPDYSDIRLVKNFQKNNTEKLTPTINIKFNELIESLQEFYTPVNLSTLKQKVNTIKGSSPLKNELLEFLKNYSEEIPPKELVICLSETLLEIRKEITSLKNSKERLTVLDLSNELEGILLKKTQDWEPSSTKELIYKIYTLSEAAAGTGLIETWEWEEAKKTLFPMLDKDDLSIAKLNDFQFTSRGIVEWSTAMVKANYQEIVDTYTSFEPKAYPFIDDRIRSAVTLDLGESVSQLGSLIAKESSLTNKVMNIPSQSSFRGLNPGYAMGEFVVVDGSPENIEVDKNKIYVFQKPPSDLKPVAGIMTVSEGNLVSHVQLLARNLGIPNAALSDRNLKSLLPFSGKQVFYAVSNKGNIILKLASETTAIEKELFSEKERVKEKVAVPVTQIKLSETNVINMANVSASYSGKLCGPKAANLGQLKSMFPDHVVNGLVIPFGIFRDHMNQSMPNTNGSYWEFLNATFSKAKEMENTGVDAKTIENFQLTSLKKLKEAIQHITLKPAFISQLRDQFQIVFNASMGSIPVFLRSDTNMEDLKEFTGAGLNLTLFNILAEKKILDGIKDVWASPYTERSFKWRQQYLSNPENVFPSILIIPSVDVEYSGVMITKGINLGNKEDLTVAFSCGAGGAVDGQSAETRLLSSTKNRLLSPARQADYLRLPKTGGTTKNITTFESPILNDKNIESIREIANEIRITLPKQTNSDYEGAYDIELGFENNKLWLFQIRPFVENKRAKSSEYLSSISPKIDYSKKINLTNKL